MFESYIPAGHLQHGSHCVGVVNRTVALQDGHVLIPRTVNLLSEVAEGTKGADQVTCSMLTALVIQVGQCGHRFLHVQEGREGSQSDVTLGFYLLLLVALKMELRNGASLEAGKNREIDSSLRASKRHQPALPHCACSPVRPL